MFTPCIKWLQSVIVEVYFLPSGDVVPLSLFVNSSWKQRKAAIHRHYKCSSVVNTPFWTMWEHFGKKKESSHHTRAKLFAGCLLNSRHSKEQEQELALKENAPRSYQPLWKKTSMPLIDWLTDRLYKRVKRIQGSRCTSRLGTKNICGFKGTCVFECVDGRDGKVNLVL